MAKSIKIRKHIFVCLGLLGVISLLLVGCVPSEAGYITLTNNVTGPPGPVGPQGPIGASGNLTGLAGTGIVAYDNTSATISIATSDNIVSTLGYMPQDTLVSGTNIKTINGSSVLGAGDLAVITADHSHTAENVTGGTENQTILSVSGKGSWTTLLMEHISGLVDALASKLSSFGYIPADNATLGQPNGIATLDGNAEVIQNPTNATATPTASKIPISDANKTVDSWVSKIVYIKCITETTNLTTGTGQAYFTIPTLLNGFNLIEVAAAVYTVSSANLPTFGVFNVTDGTNMCSTNITIDANELTSYTALTAAVIDVTHDDVATKDQIRIDCTVAGTGTKGGDIILTFRTQ